ncbi:DUF2059 domain-containing protein [Vibrio sp. NTOU-M3]|uniref:DUF2059 domain-containing protein n=1 Tax=Vibrio sp. NTOU-M3 TaxID=3234954 RepID=UPI00349FBAC7
MNFLKKTLIVTLMVFSSQSLANPHKEAAYQLIEAMELNQLMSETIDSMLQVQLQSQPQLKPFESTMREFFNTYMSGDSLKDSFAELYMSVYTEQELKELIAFLNTPTGKKSIKMTPILTAKGAAIGQQRVMENAHILERMIKEEAERLEVLKNNQ